MKLLGFKLILLLLVLGVGVPMFMTGPGGKPIMTVDDWIPHDTIAWFKRSFSGLSDLFEEGQESVTGFQPSSTGAGTEIYTWRDSNGVLHYSDTPVDGAGTLLVPHDGLEIPSDRFVQSGLGPADNNTEQPQSGRATLLKERAFPSNRQSKSGANDKTAGASLADIEAMANGDFSNAGGVMGDLPALMEQLKQAKQGVRSE